MKHDANNFTRISRPEWKAIGWDAVLIWKEGEDWFWMADLQDKGAYVSPLGPFYTLEEAKRNVDEETGRVR